MAGALMRVNYRRILQQPYGSVDRAARARRTVAEIAERLIGSDKPGTKQAEN